MAEPHDPDALLVRALGTAGLAANIFNFTVGSGIFALPAFAVARLGGAAPLAYLVCAVVIGLVGLAFAEAGSRVAATGGPYAYIEVALGPFAGFVAGCLVLATGVSAGAGVADLFARSCLALVPGLPVAVAPLVILVVVALLVAMNLRGVKSGARLTELVTVAKLVPLLIFVGVGVFFMRPANLAWERLPAAGEVFGTAGILVFAFMGIEGALVPSGEVREPSRTVPRALLLALSTTTVVYLAIQFVALGILGPALAEERVTPLAKAAGVVAGPAGRALLIVGAVVSMFGYLSANVLSEPRILFAMARDGFLPKTLAAVHPTLRTPGRAIVGYGAVLVALALTGRFETLAVFANLAALILYFLCVVAAWVLRRRDLRGAGEPFVAPGGALLPVCACAAIVWLCVATIDRRQALALGMVLALIAVLYALRRRRVA